ncbi:CspA family cold shock protein [Pseudomonas cedrina]|nr:CspA family cold shock protein [Pseudomonas cedrina]
MDRPTVKWFDAVKGIGFIARDRDGKEVAVQSTGTQFSDVPPAPPKPRKPRKRKKSSDA